ncbi:flagellar hook-associated protein FlgL [Oceanobacillus piezotolerans]|uniref:Flagellar hook-associated protein FlgL n=1 Tax=Oceanobacillus piezotolerans TaxID=2448030 RepID=A0A498DAQ4_9BACI|nr:flagellar hook-associated protein FlgL [Oceanobacillus piezotolerans]RLL46658.1 flagellar hook-associated protein FlgL [Oceanobacillus piezotolerans]
MRVTQNMLSTNMLKNLSNSYSEMGKYMEQLNTGKKINKPSDDPVVAMNGMGYRSELAQVEQFKRNTNEVHNWFDNTDAALDQATQAMQRLRELAVQASNDTYDASERQNIAAEAKQIKLDLIDIANTQVNDKYIFNGTNTNEAPFDGNGDPINIMNSNVEIEVAKGTVLNVNVSAEAVFGSGALFDRIDNFITKLETNTGDIAASLGEIDDDIDNIINARADLGARMNRLELVENRLDQQEVIATQTMSKNEDIDYAKVITQLITQESIHRAALSSGSRIIQPTLVDFLR